MSENLDERSKTPSPATPVAQASTSSSATPMSRANTLSAHPPRNVQTSEDVLKRAFEEKLANQHELGLKRIKYENDAKLEIARIQADAQVKQMEIFA